MGDYFLDGRVLFVKCNVLSSYPNIKDRLQRLSISCGLFFSCCIHKHCDNDIILYVDDQGLEDYQKNVITKKQTRLTQKQLLQELDNRATKIVAYALAIVTDSITELFDFCSIDSKISEKFLNVIIKNSKNKNIWVGINPEKDFHKLLEFYTRLGFYKPYLTRNTGGTFTPLSHTVIGLYKGGPPRTSFGQNVEMSKGKDLYMQYTRAKLGCTEDVYVPKAVCDKWREYLNLPFEVSGDLVIERYFIAPDGKSVANLVYPESTFIKGSEENFIVNISNSLINFHTHPDICYKKFGCYIGWPSGQDIARMVFTDTLKHYVVTIEGIYSMQLTLDARKYVLQYPGNVDKLYVLLKTIFNKIEGLRSVTTKDKTISVADFFSTINSLTMNDLADKDEQITEELKDILEQSHQDLLNEYQLEDLIDIIDTKISRVWPDYNLFNIALHYWDSDGFYDYTISDNCDIPIAEMDGSEIGVDVMDVD